jgi:hypothetical protein
VDATRLGDLRATAVEDLNQARLALGEHAAAVADLEVAVAVDPLRERRWAQLNVALYRCGRQAEALRAFSRLIEQLINQLGIEPSSMLRELEKAVLLQKPGLDWRDPARPAPGVVAAHTVLPELTPLLHPMDPLLGPRSRQQTPETRAAGQPAQGRQAQILAYLAAVEDIDFRTPRGLDRATIASLAGAGWVARGRRNLIDHHESP